VAAAKPKADVRVVNVSSGACYAFFPKNYRWDFTSKQFLAGAVPYEPIKWTYLFKHLFTVNMTIYGQAKMATVLFTRELQRRFDEQGVPIISTSLHPGDINSGDSSLDIFASFTRPIFKGIMITPEKGSFNSLFAATAKVIRQMPDTYKGSYMEPVGRVVVPHPVVNDDKQTRALWDITTQEVNRYLVQNSLTNLEVW
jgi:NAD(P)-dependent dehydrogenase (short-subunit alcohol dehydrogenase family)